MADDPVGDTRIEQPHADGSAGAVAEVRQAAVRVFDEEGSGDDGAREQQIE